MQIFTCDVCGQLVYFENTECRRCGHLLGFEPAAMALRALVPHPDEASPTGRFELVAAPGVEVKHCANVAQDACNWLLPADAAEAFCEACRLNRTIPDLSVPENLPRWREIETAKRRLVYALKRCGLRIGGAAETGEGGLAFEFLADNPGAPVMTGHADGLITINIAEADPAERERRRLQMGEPYRTLLGHMRHEIGHYYWDMLVRDAAEGGAQLEAARAIFGDERADYAEALARNYREGPPPGWEQNHVSSYAASHPWEDFAETWTHYLHIVDTLDTAASFGLRVDPGVTDDPALSSRIRIDPYHATAFQTLIDAWLPLTYAVNSLNRSMGQPDLYPFVLAPRVFGKLEFVHDLIGDATLAEPDAAQGA